MADRRSPMMILSYDDGPREDDSIAFPIHRRFGVPGELNIVADLVGTRRFLTAEQIAKMERAGFEIISHTCSHKTLISVPLTRRAHRGDDKLYMRKVRLTDTECRVWHEDRAEIIRTLGKGRDRYGRYVALATPLRNNYPAGALVRLTESVAEYEVAQSQRALRKLGFQADHFTYPFNEWDEECRRLVAAYYASARGGNHMAINRWQQLDPYTLCSKNFIYLSNQQITKLLDETVKRRALLIFYAHTWEDAFSARKLAFLLHEALRRDIRVVTRGQALESLAYRREQGEPHAGLGPHERV